MVLISSQPTDEGTVKNDPAAKLARKRLSVLERAQHLGSVAVACRHSSMDRTSSSSKRRFQLQGLEGLKDLLPIAKSHPHTTLDEVVQLIVSLAYEPPAWGCNRISNHLALAGVAISFPTVQHILNKQSFGTRSERLLRLEKEIATQAITLSDEQVRLIEKTNPAFRERHIESSRPGELLSQDTSYAGTLKGIGKLSLHTVVDTYGSYASGLGHTTRQPEAAVAVVHHDVLPFYQARAIAVGAMLTDTGRESCGTEHHPYELSLALNDIEHRRTKVKWPQTNGFVECFQKTVEEEFFSGRLRKKLSTSVEEFQHDLDVWLVYDNTERPIKAIAIWASDRSRW